MAAKQTGPYSVAGDPQGRGWPTLSTALSLAITIASKRPVDGEEYRHGVLHSGEVVAAAVRHADGSLTAARYDNPGGRS